MSAESSSTIGEQKRSNYALRARSSEEFVHLLTDNLPAAPEYFAQDVALNRKGAAPLSKLPLPAALSAIEVLRLQEEGVIVVDTRTTTQFGAAHVPGSIHISLTGQFASWAARIIGLGTTLIIVGEDLDQVRESHLRLARVGIEKVVGYLQDGVAGWARSGCALDSIPQITVQDLAELRTNEPEQVVVLDVRELPEWEAGAIDGAHWIPLGKLKSKTEELARQKPLVVHCRSGYRSSIATSLLRRAGFRDVANLIGGFDAWKGADLPCALPVVEV